MFCRSLVGRFSTYLASLPKCQSNFPFPLRNLNHSRYLSQGDFNKKPSNSGKLSEREYLQLQNDPDRFGPSTSSEFDQEQSLDDEDKQEEQYVTERPGRPLRTKQYADMIKDHLKGNRIREAIDVLEIRMIKEDRVKPENYIYNLLIGGCARAGYSKKSFQLFTRMKQRGLKPTGGTYTALFNACATTPYLSEGLKHANQLREKLNEDGYAPNPQNYNAMIKAYGRCGDIMTAFQLVDEMMSKRLPVKVDTMNFLLQACVSDRQFGFRHALLVWTKMLRWRQKPDIYSFNLLLRCTRDCGIGDLNTTEQVIQSIINNSQDVKMIAASESSIEIKTNTIDAPSVTASLIVEPVGQMSPDSALPNLINQKPHLGQLIILSEVNRAEDRFLLLGGIRGFLTEMANHKVEPDLKTYSELVEVIPSTLAAEKMLISLIRQQNVKVDIDFLNILIKKRSMRFDYSSAKEVLKMVKTAGLKPDIVTYGVLALGCQTEAEANDLLETMESAGVRMNIEILGAMLKQGCLRLNFPYVLFIMDLSMTENVKPNAQFLTHLHKFYKKCSGYIRDGDPRIGNEEQFSKNLFQFKVKMEEFNKQYGLVDKNLEESLKRIKVRPYEQFEERQSDGYEEIKNEKLRKRKRMRSIRNVSIEGHLDYPQARLQ